jgi:short-subunit dehydrogenase
MTAATALVTGASSGIGSALAELFAADGDDVVLVARRERRLREVAETIEREFAVTATVLPHDLATPDGPRELYEEVRSRDIAVHTLVNNAGFGNYGRFDETDLDVETTMIALNVTTVTQLSKLFLEPMIERGDGALLNTASMAGMAPTPRQAVYSSTKAYVLSFSEALAHEFEAAGITVTALCPGPVATEFFDRGNLDESAIEDQPLNDPASVARAGYDGLKSGKRVVVPSRKMRALAQFKRVLPRRSVVSLAERTVSE